MRRLFIGFSILMSCAAVSAQDLDSVTISDQFSDAGGHRGNNVGSGTTGASDPTSVSLEYEDALASQVGAGITAPNGYIRYINSWAGASNSGETETPVINPTAAYTNPDRTAETIPAASADNLTSSTSPNACITIGDDGGFNALFFGESNDSNYWVQVDAYCEDRSSAPAGSWEEVSLASRAARDDDPNLNEHTFSIDRAGSYAVTFDSATAKAYAVKWNMNASLTNINNRAASVKTVLGESAVLSTGWHTFRIEAENQYIRFYVDGVEVASVADFSYTNGRPGLQYRENGFANADERQGKFDNLHAGPQPITVTAASDWQMFE